MSKSKSTSYSSGHYFPAEKEYFNGQRNCPPSIELARVISGAVSIVIVGLIK
jgi:hypothetical protein